MTGIVYGKMYTWQVRTIGGATLHHMAMAHQRYLNWAAMVIHYMRAHGQLLRMACQGWKRCTSHP